MTSWCKHKGSKVSGYEMSHRIKFLLFYRYLHILKQLPLQHTSSTLKSLVVVSVLALAITLEGSDISREEEQFSNVRSVLYRNLLLGEKSSIKYCLLLKTKVMPIENSTESLLICYSLIITWNFKHQHKDEIAIIYIWEWSEFKFPLSCLCC